MIKRAAVRVLGIAMLLISPMAHGQWGDIYSDEPHGLGYNQLSQLSDLLELDAATHEVLFQLHHEMCLAEQAERAQVRQRIQELQEADEQPDWEDHFEWSIQLDARLDEISDRFFEDARLLVAVEQSPLIDHMKYRVRINRLLDTIGDEISGLAGNPFELLYELRLIETDRFRELVYLHAEADAKAWSLFQRAFAAIVQIQRDFREFDFDIESATPAQIGSLSRSFRDIMDLMKRFRAANETLAEAIIESLEGQQQAAFESAWLSLNYPDVQQPRPAERAVEQALRDESLDAETRETIAQMHQSYADRLRIARRMARIAKHRSDFAFDFDNIVNQQEPDTGAYEDSLERIDGVAESYAAALKGVLTKEQRIKYGLEVEPNQNDSGDSEW